MRLEDEIELRVADLFETRRDAPDAGVVHHDIEASEALAGGLDHRGASLRGGHAMRIRFRLAAGVDDHPGRRGRAGALLRVGTRAADVVHHDLRAARSQQQRMLATEATARPRHESHSSVEAQFFLRVRHRCPLSAPGAPR